MANEINVLRCVTLMTRYVVRFECNYKNVIKDYVLKH